MDKKHKFIVLVLSIFIISIIMVGVYMPKNQKKIRETWVQDVKTTEVIQTMMKLTEDNSQYIHNTGSQYIFQRSYVNNPRITINQLLKL